MSSAVAAEAPKKNALQTSFNNAIQLYRKGSFAEAKTILLEITEKAPKQYLAWYYLGHAHYRLGEFAEAAKAYSAVQTDNPQIQASGLLGAARSFRKSEDFGTAVEKILSVDDPEDNPQFTQQLKNEKEALFNEVTNQGLVDYKQDRFYDSVQAFELAAQLNATPEAQMMLGLSYYQSNQRGRAIQVLEGVLESPDGKEYWDDVEYFLNLLKPQGVQFRITDPQFEAALGVGYNSNVRLAGMAQEALKKSEMRLTLSGGVNYLYSGYFSAGLENVFSLNEVLGSYLDRYIANDTYFPFSFRKTFWNFSLTPGISYQRAGTKAFLLKPLISARAERLLGRHRLGFSINGSRNLVLDPDYSYLSGKSYGFRLDWSTAFKKSRLSARVDLSRELLNDRDPLGGIGLPLSYVGYGLGTNYAREISLKWIARTDLAYYYRRYNYLSYAFDKRIDQIILWNLEGEYELKQNHLIRPTLEIQRSFSTLRGPIYDKRIFAWSLFTYYVVRF